jgi:hypothetical protein
LKQVTIEVPDEIVSLWGSVAAFAEGTKQVMVLDALRRRQISAGKAADLLGQELRSCLHNPRLTVIIRSLKKSQAPGKKI